MKTYILFLALFLGMCSACDQAGSEGAASDSVNVSVDFDTVGSAGLDSLADSVNRKR